MSTTKSMNLGTDAPSFTLENMNPKFGGGYVSLADCAEASGLLVAFICNHCPYVVQIKDSLASFAEFYADNGLAVIAISANDADAYPADSPENMRLDAEKHNYTFPYLYDTDQHVAMAYQAQCTPDLFLFNKERKLVYRGQYDNARPGNDVSVSGDDLSAATDALLTGKPVSEDQKPSVGCSIKWKPDNQPK